MTAVVHRTVRRRGLLAAIAVVLLATGIGQTSLGHAILGRAGLFQPPASYTSLAFTSPQPVPGTVGTGKPVPISFVIGNTGGTSRLYQWSVTVLRPGQTRQVVSRTVTVAAGSQSPITWSARVSCTEAGQVRFVVSLANPAESIDALAACLAPGK